MNAKIQKWLKDRYPLHFAGWKKGKYSQVILCTFEDWEKGKAKVHEAPGVKVERLFDEDGQNSSLILYALPLEEYDKISKQKKQLADGYITNQIEWWKGAFKLGCIESKEPEWYLDQEIERVTEALEDPEQCVFNSITWNQLAIGAKYSETSDKTHPDYEGKTFNNELAYYHYYTLKAPHKRVKYWDDLDLSRYREWQEHGRQFNTPSMGCNARILAQYREHLKELKENPPFGRWEEPEAEPLPTFEDLFFHKANADKVRGLMPPNIRYYQAVCFAMADVLKEANRDYCPKYSKEVVARVLAAEFYGGEYPADFRPKKYTKAHTFADHRRQFYSKL